MFFFAHLIRVLRWGILVRALGPIRWSDITSAGGVGYMCIMVFPLRLGELVRPYLVRGKGVTATGALATVVVERVIDGLLFVALFFIFLAILPHSGDPYVETVRIAAWGAGAVFATALLVIVAAYVQRARTEAVVWAIGKRIHAGLTKKALGLLDAFLDGLAVLSDRRRVVGFLALTFVYWFLLGAGMKVMGWATHVPDLTWSGGFALLAVLVVGIMVPAGPGFTGTFELALKGGFALLVLSEESKGNIALYTVMLHITQMLVIVGFGAVFLLTGQVDMRTAFKAEFGGGEPEPE